jgi:hypothetical protein
MSKTIRVASVPDTVGNDALKLKVENVYGVTIQSVQKNGNDVTLSTVVKKSSYQEDPYIERVATQITSVVSYETISYGELEAKFLPES